MKNWYCLIIVVFLFSSNSGLQAASKSKAEIPIYQGTQLIIENIQLYEPT